MSWNFSEIKKTAQQEISAAKSQQTLETLRVQYLGRKGLIARIYAGLPALPPEEKPSTGKAANELKNKITQFLEERQRQMAASAAGSPAEDNLDPTIPGIEAGLGHRHILTKTICEICGLFEQLGFSVKEGPEIETEFNNFTALNIPLDHPSRDAFDTFYLDRPQTTDHRPQTEAENYESRATSHEPQLLRSHTSPAQIRIMKECRPPLAVVVPGRVFRPDAVDASHSFMFHQIEGLMVDKNVRFSDLKGLMDAFCKKLFGSKARTRFRPHFFPFTEPSAEVDISCHVCGGKGCSVCGRKGWLEIMGCGMVHPKVFAAVGYPKNKYTGLAFGMGVERIAMLRYGINDIRLFFENDVRFLEQF